MMNMMHVSHVAQCISTLFTWREVCVCVCVCVCVRRYARSRFDFLLIQTTMANASHRICHIWCFLCHVHVPYWLSCCCCVVLCCVAHTAPFEYPDESDENFMMIVNGRLDELFEMWEIRDLIPEDARGVCQLISKSPWSAYKKHTVQGGTNNEARVFYPRKGGRRESTAKVLEIDSPTVSRFNDTTHASQTFVFAFFLFFCDLLNRRWGLISPTTRWIFRNTIFNLTKKSVLTGLQPKQKKNIPRLGC